MLSSPLMEMSRIVFVFGLEREVQQGTPPFPRSSSMRLQRLAVGWPRPSFAAVRMSLRLHQRLVSCCCRQVRINGFERGELVRAALALLR